jgi:cation transport regulator ChaB
MPAKKELPSTLMRSPRKAQHLWMETHNSAVEQYGEEQRAHRNAFTSLKQSFEKIGGHLPAIKHHHPQPTAGADTAKSRNELMNEARSLGIQNYSSMRKPELVGAIDRANKRRTVKARDR